MCKLPDETGLYWAKRNGNDWEYIIEIKGIKPFLSYNLWNTKYPDRNSNNCNNIFGGNLSDFTFSNKIQINTLTGAPIQLDKSGIYVIFSRCLVLACVLGIKPYMSCYTWDIQKDTRSKIEKPWELSFIKYIEKPE